MSSTVITEATRPSLDRTATMHPTVRRGLDRFEVGARIGDFELLTELGSGAFARVFLARQRSMQRLVAVKISADSGTEPQTLAQLDHAYIVRVFDQLVLDPPDDGSPRLRLLYMQFLPGGTLLGLLRWVRATPPAERSGRLLLDAIDAAMTEKGEIRPADSSVRREIAELSWPDTVAWLGRRLAAALDHAADRGVLHRDVKPANVLLTAEGVPKLADFNISFSENAGTSPLSYFGGSLAYMSPEQLEASHPGHDRSPADLEARSDLFSLGVLLWELLTGTKPFDDTGADDPAWGDQTRLDAMLTSRSAGVSPTALQQLPPDCPPALRRVLLRCLEPDRTDRWPDGGVLATQFDLCQDAHARDLVDPPPNSWRIRLRPFLFPIVALSIAIPNLLAALYNAQLNTALIVDRLDPSTRGTLLRVAGVTNVAFFAFGAAILIYLARRLLIAPRRLRSGRGYHSLDRARRDSLRLGNQAVAIAFILWLSAAAVFAATIGLAGNGLTIRTALHFALAAAICAAIAMTYPFFLITLYLTRCTYPLFLHHGEDFRSDGRALTGLIVHCHRYLIAAASIPLVAGIGATFLPVEDLRTTTTPLRAICVGGVIGFVVSYVLFRIIEADIRALLRVVGSRTTN
ncbi:serine/threonine-protein kinase [Nocardia sp. PE-7]|uniref:serine/threonine-protein kinase n=1 Tax=Nocardia sp. PE-7 TaxID=3058426 RepID=UPI002659C0BC|nr:serine/threonine-protein kinase [Nocardia sp. PE-7]WKG09945.1 serine/threonine-protein kinase [Nocardia sp. PE-7]